MATLKSGESAVLDVLRERCVLFTFHRLTMYVKPMLSLLSLLNLLAACPTPSQRCA